MKKEVATFAGGCFWGIEDLFRKTEGVKDTEVGYTGGDFANPSYEDVCSGTTGHAEAVNVFFNPKEISYEALVRLFFENHDPTTENAQGPDIGEQYRSAIFFHSPEQEATARKVKEELEKKGAFVRPIVTEIFPAGIFWRAEEYHQHYFEKNGGGSCRV